MEIPFTPLVEPTIETAQKLYLLHCYFSIVAKSPHMLVIFRYNIFVHIYIYTYKTHICTLMICISLYIIYICTLLVDFALFSVGQTIQFAAYIRPQVRAKARHHLGKWHHCIPWRCHPSRPLAPTKVVKSSWTPQLIRKSEATFWSPWLAFWPTSHWWNLVDHRG